MMEKENDLFVRTIEAMQKRKEAKTISSTNLELPMKDLDDTPHVLNEKEISFTNSDLPSKALDNTPHFFKLNEMDITEMEDTNKLSCTTTFSFRIAGFICSVDKASPMIPDYTGKPVCPFLYPYLRILVNSRFQTAMLAKSPHPPTYDFGDIDLPSSTPVRTLNVSVSLYFNTSFDILANTNKTLDLNPDVRGGDFVVLDWYAQRQDQASPFTQRGDFSCSGEPAPRATAESNTGTAAAAAAITSPGDAVTAPPPPPQCPFSRRTPGFWDRSARAFVPNGCAYRADAAWPRRPPARRGMVWVHLLGDSNMRKLHGAVCRHMGADVTYHGRRHPPRPGQALVWSACFARDMTAAVVHSVSWMTGKSSQPTRRIVFIIYIYIYISYKMTGAGKSSLDTALSPRLVGATLSRSL
jgi:hypothetical protein